MLSTTQKKILAVLLRALKPIARVLLRTGIGYREFSEIAKTAFVDVATSDYGIRGRPTNISRVAAMTGLTRKEIKRLRDKMSDGEACRVYRATPASDVLHFWYTDPKYLDSDGRPRSLPFDKGDGATFVQLVKAYGGDIPAGAMRTELKRVGAVEQTETGDLIALRRSFSLPGASEKVIEGMIGIAALADTVAHNSECSETGEATFIQRIVDTKWVRQEDIGRLRRISRDRLIEFSESIDDLFSAYESLYEGEDDKSGKRKSIGVGLYYFEDSVPKSS